MPEVCELLTCPFCLNQCTPAESGKTECPVCAASFEGYDRDEFTFGHATDNIELPVVGVICGQCGLVQAGDNRNCLYCGAEINIAVR